MRRVLYSLASAGLLVFSSMGQAQPPERDRSGADPAVVIMMLSPRMVYAFSEWPRMKRAAEEAGFVVQSVRDPRIGDDEWRLAAIAADRPQMLELPSLPDVARSIENFPALLNHSPTSIVRLGGRAHPWPIIGVMPDAAWTGLLRQRLDQLRAR